MSIRIPMLALVALALLAACQSVSPPSGGHAIACRPAAPTTPGGTSEQAMTGCDYVQSDAQLRLAGTSPEYDVEQSCQALSNSVGDDPLGLIKAACLDSEFGARERIASMSIPQDVRDRSAESADNPRGGSYRDFESCANEALGVTTSPEGG